MIPQIKYTAGDIDLGEFMSLSILTVDKSKKSLVRSVTFKGSFGLDDGEDELNKNLDDVLGKNY